MLKISDSQKNIFNVLAEGVLIIDDKGIVVFANEAYRSFLKMKEEEITGRKS